MNKAFVREPDADAGVLCPVCGARGISVSNAPLEVYVPEPARTMLRDAAWCCQNTACEVVYYSMFGQFFRAAELSEPAYPYDIGAPVCPCFGFTLEDIEADAAEDEPARIRDLLTKSRSSEARCGMLALDGQCCMKEVQRLYWKLKSSPRG